MTETTPINSVGVDKLAKRLARAAAQWRADNIKAVNKIPSDDGQKWAAFTASNPVPVNVADVLAAAHELKGYAWLSNYLSAAPTPPVGQVKREQIATIIRAACMKHAEADLDNIDLDYEAADEIAALYASSPPPARIEAEGLTDGLVAAWIKVLRKCPLDGTRLEKDAATSLADVLSRLPIPTVSIPASKDGSQ